MLGTSHFYHSTLRKYVIMFGSMFNDIQIVRKNKDKKTVQVLDVPITYGPKQKWVILTRDRVPEKQVAIQYPRLSFEITNLTLDTSERGINPLQRNSERSTDPKLDLSQFTPIPYKLNWNLYIVSKNTDDLAQIYEQIVPYFTPDFTNVMHLIPEIDHTFDIPTRIQGIGMEDVYEGEFLDRNSLVWTVMFESDVWFFGPIQKMGPIKRVKIDLNLASGNGPMTPEDIANAGRASLLTTWPGLTSDGKPTSNTEIAIPYQEVDEEDDYGFCETLTSDIP